MGSGRFKQNSPIIDVHLLYKSKAHSSSVIKCLATKYCEIKLLK